MEPTLIQAIGFVDVITESPGTTRGMWIIGDMRGNLSMLILRLVNILYQVGAPTIVEHDVCAVPLPYEEYVYKWISKVRASTLFTQQACGLIGINWLWTRCKNNAIDSLSIESLGKIPQPSKLCYLDNGKFPWLCTLVLQSWHLALRLLFSSTQLNNISSLKMRSNGIIY